MGAESGVWKVKSGVWRVESGAEGTRLPPLQGGGGPQSGGGVLIKRVESGERRPMYIANF